jgi:hypothetical protein
VVSRSEREIVLDAPRPDADVVIGPGVAGRKDQSIYPSSATDLVKRLRAKNLSVQYLQPPPHNELKLMADEFWLPLLIFGRDVLVSGVAEVVLTTIKEQIGAIWPRARLHAQIATAEVGATKLKVVTLDGAGEDVLAAIEQLFPMDADTKELR